jgi:hypothetical protein
MAGGRDQAVEIVYVLAGSLITVVGFAPAIAENAPLLPGLTGRRQAGAPDPTAAG